jgi:hypothetical protein
VRGRGMKRGIASVTMREDKLVKSRICIDYE